MDFSKVIASYITPHSYILQQGERVVFCKNLPFTDQEEHQASSFSNFRTSALPHFRAPALPRFLPFSSSKNSEISGEKLQTLPFPFFGKFSALPYIETFLPINSYFQFPCYFLPFFRGHTNMLENIVIFCILKIFTFIYNSFHTFRTSALPNFRSSALPHFRTFSLPQTTADGGASSSGEPAFLNGTAIRYIAIRIRNIPPTQ